MNLFAQLRTATLGGLVVVAMSTVSHATVFQTGNPGGSFSLGTGWLDQGDDRTLDILWIVAPGFSGQTFDLSTVGDAETLSFGTAVFTSESRISETETENLEITANIDLALPDILNFSSIGVVGTVVGPTNDADIDVTVDFASVSVAFGTTGLFGLNLSPVVFTNDKSEAGIEATFTLLAIDTPLSLQTPPSDPPSDPPSNSPSTSVPEPATLGLFGLGLAGLGFMRRRRSA